MALLLLSVLVMIKLLSLVITVGIYIFDGWKGLAISVFMMVLFEWMHYRVYGKSISEI